MKLSNIQALRACAALMVVHAHAAGPTGLGLHWFGGANGVDLFFVISGFIIAYVASKDPDRFMTRRLIRIVPIYWISTLALYALVLALPHFFRTTSSSFPLLVRSLLFVPDSSAVHTTDGIPHPTLAGGWTLNYEMYFYVVFWLALAISRRRATLCASVGIVGIVVAMAIADPASPVARFYGNPIVLEFVFGLVAFHLARALGQRCDAMFRTPFGRAVLVACVVGGLICLAFTRELFGPAPRWLSSGIPAFFVVLAAILLEQLEHVRVTNSIAILVGDASYVLYLLHAYIVFGMIRFAIHGRSFSEAAGQIAVLGLLVISAAIACLVYVKLEAPMLQRLKVMFLPANRRARSKLSPQGVGGSEVP